MTFQIHRLPSCVSVPNWTQTNLERSSNQNLERSKRPMNFRLESGINRKNEFMLKPPMLAFSSGSRATVTKNWIQYPTQPIQSHQSCTREYIGYRGSPSLLMPVRSIHKNQCQPPFWDNYCIDRFRAPHGGQLNIKSPNTDKVTTHYSAQAVRPALTWIELKFIPKSSS